MGGEAAAPGRDRIDEIDALRGLALFGILLANILYWSGWSLVTDAERLVMADATAQVWQYRFHHLLIDGKFYTLFSMLFGAGFAIQLDRLSRRGADGLRIYRRRVLILLAFGLIHVVLIWDGDILTLYALLGLALPLFRRWSNRQLLWAAAILIFLVPVAGATLFDALGWKPHQYFYDLSERIARSFGATTKDPIGWLQSDDPRAFVTWVLSGWPYAIGTRLEGWRIPKVLGIMLLGLYLGRRLVSGDLLDDRRLMWRTLIAGLAIGVPFSLIYAAIPDQGQEDLPSILGTVPLALAYAAAFVLAWPHLKRWLGLLAAPGRMALTNYLSHSLLGIILFYGIGIGLIGRLPPLGFYAVAIVIFAAQIAVSNWWLSRHAQGPMEALWRRLTYGRQSA